LESGIAILSSGVSDEDLTQRRRRCRRGQIDLDDAVDDSGREDAQVNSRGTFWSSVAQVVSPPVRRARDHPLAADTTFEGGSLVKAVRRYRSRLAVDHRDKDA
jgi:hypothetical protein